MSRCLQHRTTRHQKWRLTIEPIVMNSVDWIRVTGASRTLCKFCRQLVYWKKKERRTDQYGNVIYAPPCEARLSEDGAIEYRDVPHKCKR